jgi:tetratricopeptide (TPR) repeat protein
MKVAITVIIALSFFSCRDNKQADEEFRTGAKYYQKGNLDSAFIHLSQADHLYDDGERKGSVKMYLGEIMRKIGARGRASEYYLEAMKLLTDNEQLLADAMTNMGLVLAESGNVEEAEEYIYAAIKYYNQESSISNALNILAYSYKENKNYQKAIKTYKRSLERGHDKGKIFNNIGSVYLELGNYDSAIYYLQIAANEKKELKGSTYTNLARAYLTIDTTKSQHYANLAIDEKDTRFLYETHGMLAKGTLNKNKVIKHQEVQLGLLYESMAEKQRLEKLCQLYQIQAYLMKEAHRRKTIYWSVGGSLGMILIIFLFYRFHKANNACKFFQRKIAIAKEKFDKLNQ